MVKLIGKFKDPDSTLKYVFKDDHGTIEITKINTKPDRDIFCVPCLYGCTLGCSFCFLTTHNISKNNNPIQYSTIEECLSYFEDVKPDRQISIMGVGDSSLNIPFILEAASKESRVSIASIFPIMLPKLPNNVKIHFSLHSTTDEKRRLAMPSARIPIEDVLMYLKSHEGATEIHYTLIDGVNDSDEELEIFKELINKYKITVKFLAFRESKELKESPHILDWLYELTSAEYYDPPGRFVQGSCGQFTKALYSENPDTSCLKEYEV